MSKQQPQVILMNKQVITVDMNNNQWTLSGLQHIFWFQLTPYYKRFIRLAVQSIAHADAILHTFQSIQLDYAERHAASQGEHIGDINFKWHDPKLAPFALAMNSNDANIETSIENHTSSRLACYFVQTDDVSVAIQQVHYHAGSTKSYWSVYMQKQGYDPRYYGKFEVFSSAFTVAEDLVADQNSHAPFLDLPFEYGYHPITLANGDKFYVHQALISDPHNPQFHWFISDNPIIVAEHQQRTIRDYYRNQKNIEGSVYIGDIHIEHLLNAARTDAEIANRISFGFKNEKHLSFPN